jgi:hypothetical protein
MGGVTDPS